MTQWPNPVQPLGVDLYHHFCHIQHKASQQYLRVLYFLQKLIPCGGEIPVRNCYIDCMPCCLRVPCFLPIYIIMYFYPDVSKILSRCFICRSKFLVSVKSSTLLIVSLCWKCTNTFVIYTLFYLANVYYRYIPVSLWQFQYTWNKTKNQDQYR